MTEKNKPTKRTYQELGYHTAGMSHQSLVSLLVHIRDHGDTTLLTRLFVLLPKGSRLKSYFDWCSKFAPLTVSTSKDSFGTVKLRKGWTPKQFDILGAMATAPWDRHSPGCG